MLQKSSVLGDLDKNFKIIEKSFKKCVSNNCDFFLTTELFLTGYPPQDLILRNDFLNKVQLYKKKIKALTKNKSSILLLNIPEKTNNKIFNTLFLFKNGSIIYKKNKSVLPNYGVFDEKRYFDLDKTNVPDFTYKNKKIRFLICEEMWSKNLMINSNKNIDYLICINASPYEINKYNERKKIVARNAKFFKSNVIYLNYVGCQDDLIFDGGTFVMNKKAEIIHQCDFFKESESIVNIERIENKKIKKINYSTQSQIYCALICSLQSYLKNNNFKKVIIGLSGGIDSALCLMIAVDALKSENIKCFYLPTIYNSKQSKKDAYQLAKNLNVDIDTISIETLRKKTNSELKPFFHNKPQDITEENVQSRLRGLLLMSISNKFNSLLITTGNKSELAIGYSTLYGDMCGGFSLIKDLYKTQVFELSKWRNKIIPDFCNFKKTGLIPESIILKEPSAELKMNQKDEDSLPKYSVLDKILELIVDKNYDLQSIKKYGFNQRLIRRIWNMLKNAEFKRYQSAIGPKISSMSFDKDRRFPITNKFKI